ncbi:SDR family NAD(P)-dependent oxidoreductase [uncultured Clostridium sp.]|uniref:SDR family NAD(P)-dependent oxidoreductase n=1 Tax=uncultured Clostridium sp. TaxID=59620 RepID=UPI00262A6827|nr:SDR family NAD(P)-dependent oxidoreductase [uncultured Clostridium sp.]
MKTVLITGATRGIGKYLAKEFASNGYSVHIIGRNEECGNEVIKELESINNKCQHRFFSVDLSLVSENKKFLEFYKNKYKSLDILILNANIRPKKRIDITREGYNNVLITGVISKYLFSVGLKNLLENAEASKVIHIGDARLLQKISYNKFIDGDISGMKSLLGAYTGSAYISNFFAKKSIMDVHTEFINPGMVNTDGESASFWIKMISKKTDYIAKRIATHIINNDSIKKYVGFFNIDKENSLAKKLDKKESEFNKLMSIIGKITK